MEFHGFPQSPRIIARISATLREVRQIQPRNNGHSPLSEQQIAHIRHRLLMQPVELLRKRGRDRSCNPTQTDPKSINGNAPSGPVRDSCHNRPGRILPQMFELFKSHGRRNRRTTSQIRPIRSSQFMQHRSPIRRCKNHHFRKLIRSDWQKVHKNQLTLSNRTHHARAQRTVGRRIPKRQNHRSGWVILCTLFPIRNMHPQRAKFSHRLPNHPPA